jgi:hypothetical protein
MCLLGCPYSFTEFNFKLYMMLLFTVMKWQCCMTWRSRCHKCGVFMFITHVLILWNGWRDDVEGKCQCMIKNQCNMCPWRIRAYLSPNKVILTPCLKGIVRIIEVIGSRHVGPIYSNGCKYEVRLNLNNLGTGLMLNGAWASVVVKALHY